MKKFTNLVFINLFLLVSLMAMSGCNASNVSLPGSGSSASQGVVAGNGGGWSGLTTSANSLIGSSGAVVTNVSAYQCNEANQEEIIEFDNGEAFNCKGEAVAAEDVVEDYSGFVFSNVSFLPEVYWSNSQQLFLMDKSIAQDNLIGVSLASFPFTADTFFVSFVTYDLLAFSYKLYLMTYNYQGDLVGFTQHDVHRDGLQFLIPAEVPGGVSYVLEVGGTDAGTSLSAINSGNNTNIWSYFAAEVFNSSYFFDVLAVELDE